MVADDYNQSACVSERYCRHNHERDRVRVLSLSAAAKQHTFASEQFRGVKLLPCKQTFSNFFLRDILPDRSKQIYLGCPP